MRKIKTGVRKKGNQAPGMIKAQRTMTCSRVKSGR